MLTIAPGLGIGAGGVSLWTRFTLSVLSLLLMTSSLIYRFISLCVVLGTSEAIDRPTSLCVIVRELMQMRAISLSRNEL